MGEEHAGSEQRRTEPGRTAHGGPDHAGAGEPFWFNPVTRQVEQGRQSPWTSRMGPYPTREAAERALDGAQDRSEAWDEEDRRWRE